MDTRVPETGSGCICVRTTRHEGPHHPATASDRQPGARSNCPDSVVGHILFILYGSVNWRYFHCVCSYCNTTPGKSTNRTLRIGPFSLFRLARLPGPAPELQQACPFFPTGRVILSVKVKPPFDLAAHRRRSHESCTRGKISQSPCYRRRWHKHQDAGRWQTEPREDIHLAPP